MKAAAVWRAWEALAEGLDSVLSTHTSNSSSRKFDILFWSSWTVKKFHSKLISCSLALFFFLISENNWISIMMHFAYLSPNHTQERVLSRTLHQCVDKEASLWALALSVAELRNGPRTWSLMDGVREYWPPLIVGMLEFGWDRGRLLGSLVSMV